MANAELVPSFGGNAHALSSPVSRHCPRPHADLDSLRRLPDRLAGRGGNPELADAAQQVYDRFNGYDRSRANGRTAEGGEGGGRVVGLQSNNDIEDVAAAFKEKYGLDIKTYRADSETVLQRILQEDNANFHGADVLETTPRR